MALLNLPSFFCVKAVAMIPYARALQIIRDAMMSRKLATETVPLADAVGRVCAADLTAGLDIQPFDNAAMDGFAVRRDDLAQASGAHPVRLPVAGVISAGEDATATTLAAGTCWRIMTGAMIPAGCDAVVQGEDVGVEDTHAVFTGMPPLGLHIRRKGEDFRKGDTLLARGSKVGVAHVLPLATQGIGTVTVFKKPRILFIPTGLELVDTPGVSLAHGQIYNSNRCYAESFLRALGAEVTVCDIVRDDPVEFAGILTQAMAERYDLVVSSGAVSAGAFDFVSSGLRDAGARILYHKVAMKPGKPNLLAVLPSETIYFGLPGNPVATAVGLRFFVAEALRILWMQKPELPVYAQVSKGISFKAGLSHVLKGRLDYGADGVVRVSIFDGQESFKVSPFLDMNCWVHVAPERAGLEDGDLVEAYMLQV